MYDKNEGGYDWAFSREPKELKKLVTMIRKYEKLGVIEYETECEKNAALLTHGNVCFEPTEREIASREARPTLWAVEDIKKGELFKFAAGRDGNFDSIRPGNGGLHIRFTNFLLDKVASCDIAAGTPLNWDYVEI
jgi:sialic acid synthase SpsE